MRRAILALLAAVLLAGCSGGNGASAHVLSVGDLGPGFTYVSEDHPEYGAFMEFFGMKQNPGFGNVSLVHDDGGPNATSLYVSLLYHEASDGVVFSAAVTFRTVADMEVWINEEFEDCADASGNFAAFRSGSTLSFHDAEELGSDMMGRFQQGLDNIIARTGAQTICR